MSLIERRRFLTAASALVAVAAAGTPKVAHAQQSSRAYTIGVLLGGDWKAEAPLRAALVERLAKHGLVEGGNLRVEARRIYGGYGSGAAVRELVALRPDALLTCLTSGTMAAKAVAGTIPIVFVWVADPIASNLVQSYARPGRNITGVTNRFGEILVKRLELAHDLLPGARRVAVAKPPSPWAKELYRSLGPPLRRAAEKRGVELVELPVYDWSAVVEQAKAAGAAAVIPFNGFAATATRRLGETVVKEALKQRVPVIYAGAEMVEAGGLMSYGTNLVEDLRRGADMLARVLKGANPATIPVDQAARFELAVNLKTAKAIGITIPQSILVRADRVIE